MKTAEEIKQQRRQYYLSIRDKRREEYHLKNNIELKPRKPKMTKADIVKYQATYYEKTKDIKKEKNEARDKAYYNKNKDKIREAYHTATEEQKQFRADQQRRYRQNAKNKESLFGCLCEYL